MLTKETKKLGIDTTEKANAILTKFYPPNMILPKTMYVIEECLAALGLGEN